MRFSKELLFLILVAAFASCKAGHTDDNATITVNGRLYPKGNTTYNYNYGTHVVTVSAYNAYLVESTSIDLNSFNGDSVQVVLKDMGIRQNPGMELYNVIQVNPL